MSGFRHKKRFGQHFLKDPFILSTIVGYADLEPGKVCIEIGPGQGALTQYLLQTGSEIIAIELDTRLEKRLRSIEAKKDHFTLVMADALESDFVVLTQHRKFSLVSNLPYEISTPLLFKLINYANQVQEVVLLLQQEVVQRMCATVGSSHYGRLSVMAQYHFKCEALLEVNPEAFSPPPKVMSQVVRLQPIERDDSINLKDFECFVKALFLHRRKMIRQQFKLIPQDAWQSIDIEPTQRPQSLSVSAVIKLFKLCVHYNCLPKC